jgi:hypothetical protein
VTHKEALQHGGHGLEPTDCEGELELLDAFADDDLVDGQRVAREIVVYRCPLCGRRVSMWGPRPLNCYLVPATRRELVRGLADAFDPQLPE